MAKSERKPLADESRAHSDAQEVTVRTRNSTEPASAILSYCPFRPWITLSEITIYLDQLRFASSRFAYCQQKKKPQKFWSVLFIRFQRLDNVPKFCNLKCFAAKSFKIIFFSKKSRKWGCLTPTVKYFCCIKKNKWIKRVNTVWPIHLWIGFTSTVYLFKICKANLAKNMQ